MTLTYDTFVIILCTTLFILACLLSFIPAYIARRHNKRFWYWWLATLRAFVFFLVIIIQTQNMSVAIYSLGIVPIASVLASLSTSAFATTGESSRPAFWETLAGIAIVGIALSYFLSHVWSISPSNDRAYFAAMAFVILICGLSVAALLFVLYGKSLKAMLLIVLTDLVMLLVLVWQGGDIYQKIINGPHFASVAAWFSPTLRDLSAQPKNGALVLLAISSGFTVLIVRLNDTFGLGQKFAPLFQAGVRQSIFGVPTIK